MALAGEIGELLEIFQWLTPEEADAVIGSPLATDVDDVLDVDLLAVARAMLERNRGRFPPNQVSGPADVPPAKA